MNKMCVLVFGANGLLGSSLLPYLKERGYALVSAGRSSMMDYIIDPRSENQIHNLLIDIKPDVIINLIGATNVDACELDVSMAVQSNLIIPKAISDSINQSGNKDIHLIHVSTDQVYNGNGNSIESMVDPVNVYGLSKLAGELVINSATSTILRTNFFGKSKCESRTSFSDWVLRSLISKDNIVLYKNVFFNALHISTLCELVESIIIKKVFGTYNAGCRDGISKSEFALRIAEKLNLTTDSVVVGDFESCNLKAKRPLNMVMNVQKLESVIGKPCPWMDDEINKAIKEHINA